MGEKLVQSLRSPPKVPGVVFDQEIVILRGADVTMECTGMCSDDQVVDTMCVEHAAHLRKSSHPRSYQRRDAVREQWPHPRIGSETLGALPVGAAGRSGPFRREGVASVYS